MNPGVCGFMHQKRRVAPAHKLGMLAEIQSLEIYVTSSKLRGILGVSKAQPLLNDVFNLRANELETP